MGAAVDPNEDMREKKDLGVEEGDGGGIVKSSFDAFVYWVDEAFLSFVTVVVADCSSLFDSWSDGAPAKFSMLLSIV